MFLPAFFLPKRRAGAKGTGKGLMGEIELGKHYF
jgi:hypothetical protein